jgi:hypothetical protein
LFRWQVIDVGGGGVVQWSECSKSAVTADGRQAVVDAGTGFAAQELSGRRGSNGKLTTAFRSPQKRAQGAAAARRKKTISKLPKSTRTALGKQGAKMAKRKKR